MSPALAPASMSATGPLGTTDAKAGSSVASRPTSLVCVDRAMIVARIVPSSPRSASRSPAYGPGAGTPCQRAAANTMLGCFFSPGSWSTQARTSSSAATPSAHSTKHGDSPSQCAANSRYWAATPPYGSTFPPPGLRLGFAPRTDGAERAMTTFLVIGIVGLVLVGVSLVLGDIFDGVFDALAGDVFSSAVIGGFVSAFGFGAALMQGIGTPAVLSVPVGIAAGVLVGWLAWWLTRLVKDGGSDGTLTADDALGRSGRVITSIPADGFGTVRLMIGGHSVQLNAKAEAPVDQGTEVHVTQILSPTAVLVAPVWNELP